jgi:hypothetical protein
MYFSSHYQYFFPSFQSGDKNQMSLSSLLEASVKGKRSFTRKNLLVCVHGSFTTLQDRSEYSDIVAHRQAPIYAF